MARRVFLLGLDGGSWNVFDHLMAQGAMPNLRRLCGEGVKGTLESTTPPVTPVAWTSLMTGVNPGKHGVFAFRKPMPTNSYLPMPVNRTDMAAPTIFDYYRDDPGFVSLNLPMSFPASPIAGRMVTGMMTPEGAGDRAQHPADLLDRFAAAGIDYVIDPKLQEGGKVDPENLLGHWSRDPSAIVERLGRITDARMAAARLLMDERDWSVFICVIVGTDRLQHMFWDEIMAETADDPRTAAIRDYYAKVDGHIGRLMADLDPVDALLLVSDHGFVKNHGTFRTNEWLRRHGWLKRREARRSPLYPVKKLLGRLGITRARLGRVLSKDQESKLQMMASHVDWSSSQAFLSGPFAIRLNVRGRETAGCVEPAAAEGLRNEIAAALRELRDEEGRLLIDRVDLGSDLYHGDGGGQPGDIVFTFRDELNRTAYIGDLGGDVLQDDPTKSGDHRIDGIFAVWGGGVATRDEHVRLSICDVLPTLMHMGGRAVPAVCDGRVATELLSDSAEVRLDEDWRRYMPGDTEVVYSSDQESEINNRLKALGYLSED